MTIDTDTFRVRLLARRTELETLSAAAADARAPVALDQQSVGRLSRMDAMQQQAMAQAAERQRAGEIARIGRALQRIADGSYGECVECGEAIAARRLENDPAVALCIACARVQER